MRFATLAALVAAITMGMGIAFIIAIACTGCSSDAGTSLGALERRSGGFAGSGAPSTPSSNEPTDNGAGNETGSPAPHPAPSPIDQNVDAGSSAPVPSHDAGTGTTAIDSGSSNVGGCANGCADGCLTLAINFCKTASADYQDFCDQVPAACACNETGTTPPAPSLDQCIADIENADPNGDDDSTN